MLSSPSFAETSVITAIKLQPTSQGDLLLITYKGELETLNMSINRENQATLKLPKTFISPELTIKKRSGQLIKSLTVNTAPSSHTKIILDFKRRLGRHSKTYQIEKGQKTLQIELLDEVAEPKPPATEKSVIQAVIEPGMFELDGTKEKKMLDYNEDDRKKISTEEFLTLFGTKIVPRPNRITSMSQQLTNESLKIMLSFIHRPSYTLRSRKNPPGIELKIMNTLGDIEIYHTGEKHDFLGNLTSTRTGNNTLTLKTAVYETAETSSKVIKNSTGTGYQLVINIKRIYPWETEEAIPKMDTR